ncbi:hypothetical protein diail_2906 [Diaporthe ilicicola]|nr:hypothetical protein diail_2906 [Diaporthe ilicicola]
MQGPEQCGLEVFTIAKVEEIEVQNLVWQGQPADRHYMKFSGELIINRWRYRRNTLPRNMWDRQRDGGFLSDGITRVLWTIHDNHIPGRRSARWFDVLFSKPTFLDAFDDWSTQEEWRGFVRKEWEEYLGHPERVDWEPFRM